MQRNYKVGTILIFISVLITQQSCARANPAEQRLTRQTKGSHNEGGGTPQEEMKILSGQLTLNPPQMLPNFSVNGGPISSLPFGGRYGGITFGGSGYPGSPGMGLLSMQFGNAPNGIGFNGLQLGNPAGLGYPALGNYVGYNLPPYPLNGPDVYTNYLFNGLPQMQSSSFGPSAAGAQNVDNYLNMANLQGVAGAGGSQMPVLGAQGQLQGQASQLQPQLAAPYPYRPTFYGQLNSYGPAFQGYQML